MASVTATPDAAADNGPARRPIAGRLAGLAQAVEGTRRTSRFEIRQVMLALGASCMGLGIVAVVLGWYGAAHSAYLFQEIPYLISGGLLGVALVAGGGFLFFASWLVRMIEDNHRHASRLERTLDRVDLVLGAVAGDAAMAGSPQETSNGGGAGADWQDLGPPMGRYREESSYAFEGDAGGPTYDPAGPTYDPAGPRSPGPAGPRTSPWADEPPPAAGEEPTEGGDS